MDERRRVALLDEILRVGPKGYIHGWILVGAPGVGAKVFHPHHGHGTVTAHSGTHATVKFDKGAEHSFKAQHGPGPGRLEYQGVRETAGSATGKKAQEHIASLAGKVRPRELDVYNVGDYKRDRLDPAFRYTPGQHQAIHNYADHSFELNTQERGGTLDYAVFQADKLAAEADQISSAMQPLPDDLVLLREVKGMNVLQGVQPGEIIADKGFSSTTLTSSGRYATGRSDTTVLHIMTPKGTPVVWANPAATFPEDEVILDRGQPLAVMKIQQRPGRSNVTDVFLVALPKKVMR